MAGCKIFGEWSSPAADVVIVRASGLLTFVSKALRAESEPGKKLHDHMPSPFKDEESLRLGSSKQEYCERETRMDLQTLVFLIRTLKGEGREMVASELPTLPVLHTMLEQLPLIARHFLMTPALAVLAFRVSHKWKASLGFSERQSWVYLEFSERRVVDAIPHLLPRISSFCTTDMVARLIDDVERLAMAIVDKPKNDPRCGLEELRASGIYNEEWLGDDPLAAVALEIIQSKGTAGITPVTRAIRYCKYDLDVYEGINEEDVSPDPLKQALQCSDAMFRMFATRHSLQFLSIRVIGLKLVNTYIKAAHAHPEVHLHVSQRYQRRNQLELIRYLQYCSLGSVGVELDDERDVDNIEDMLHQASELLRNGQVCECCGPGYRAIVECAASYSIPLAKARLPVLARDVLRHWKAGHKFQSWTLVTPLPFAAPILDEIETYSPVDFKTGEEAKWSAPRPLEFLVDQYRKAKSYGLVPTGEVDDLVLTASVGILEMVDAGRAPPLFRFMPEPELKVPLEYYRPVAELGKGGSEAREDLAAVENDSEASPGAGADGNKFCQKVRASLAPSAPVVEVATIPCKPLENVALNRKKKSKAKSKSGKKSKKNKRGIEIELSRSGRIAKDLSSAEWLRAWRKTIEAGLLVAFLIYVAAHYCRIC